MTEYPDDDEMASAGQLIDTETTLEEFVDIARSRRTIRAFLDKPIPDDVLQMVLEAANWAPSGANTQPWEFIVVRQDERKETIADILHKEEQLKGEIDQSFPTAGYPGRVYTTVPVILVLAADTRYDQWWPQILDGSREKIFHHSIAACVQNLHLACATAGLGTLWETCRPATEHRLRELLDLPDYYRIGTVSPIGYPDPDKNPSERSRTPLELKVHDEYFDIDQVPDTADIHGRDDIRESKQAWSDRVYREAGKAGWTESVYDDSE